MSFEDKELEDFYASLLDLGGYSESDIQELKNSVKSNSPVGLSEKLLKEPEGEEEDKNESSDIRYLISKMKLSEKIKTAFFGNAACRSILISAPNKLVQFAVLKNPGLRGGEIEGFAKNANTSQYVLRIMSTNRKWMKDYALKYNLVTNPKTPPDIALKWIKYINRGDIKNIARSKGMSQVVVNAAKRMKIRMEKR